MGALEILFISIIILFMFVCPNDGVCQWKMHVDNYILMQACTRGAALNTVKRVCAEFESGRKFGPCHTGRGGVGVGVEPRVSIVPFRSEAVHAKLSRSHFSIFTGVVSLRSKPDVGAWGVRQVAILKVDSTLLVIAWCKGNVCPSS